MLGDGPVARVWAELQQELVEAILRGVTPNQQHTGVSAHRQGVAGHRGQQRALQEERMTEK